MRAQAWIDREFAAPPLAPSPEAAEKAASGFEFRVTHLGCCYILPPIMENQMEKNMENDMETGGNIGI